MAGLTKYSVQECQQWKQDLVYVLNRNQMGGLDETKKWTAADLKTIRPDTTADQRPDDYGADHVVRKFQVGFHQYIPANPTHLAIPGSPVASQNQRELFTVGRNQAAYVTWKVDGTNWSDTSSGVRVARKSLLPGLCG